MKHKLSPCFSCHKKTCVDCEYRVWGNYKITYSDQIIENLWKEISDVVFVENSEGEFVLDQPWRGFPKGIFTQEEWFGWVDNHHTKGVGWVCENVR